MHFEQMQPPIDFARQLQLLHQQVDERNPAIRRADVSPSQIEMNVRFGEHGMGRVFGQTGFIESALHSPLACGETMSQNVVHSKFLVARGVVSLSHTMKPRKTTKDFEFFVA
jgi:hypothetical protein